MSSAVPPLCSTVDLENAAAAATAAAAAVGWVGDAPGVRLAGGPGWCSGEERVTPGTLEGAE